MKLALHAVQLAVGIEHIADVGALRVALDRAGAEAVAQAERVDARLIVFPAHVSTVVALAMSPPAARRAATLRLALAASVTSRPWTALRTMLEHATVDPRRTALAALAPEARAWSFSYFASLAKQCGAHIVAGSGPRLLRAGRPVNSAMIFSPDGRLASVADQVNLLPGLDDAGGLALSRGEGREPPSVATRFGRLATLVGYDAQPRPLSSAERFAFLTEGLGRLGPSVVATPLALPESQAERLQTGLDAGLAGCSAYGVRSCLAGRLFERVFTGRSGIVRADDGTVESLAEATSNESAQVLSAVVEVAPVN